jgi:hypothetical protein
MSNTVERACDELKQSARFKKVLKGILKVSNQLNDGVAQVG